MPPVQSKAVLLSADRPVRSSVRGNLAPASVVTRKAPPAGGKAAWLNDRWQAASDMSGTPIAGPHWLSMELAARCSVREVVLDWETACADDYDLQFWTAGRWESLDTAPRRRSTRHQHVVDRLSLRRPRRHDSAVAYRLYIRRPATAWGVSLWRFELWGECSSAPEAAARASPPREDADMDAEGVNESVCRALKASHAVQPGQSWGRLSEARIREWKTRRCDRYFCRPSRMEAVGKYPCEPL